MNNILRMMPLSLLVVGLALGSCEKPNPEEPTMPLERVVALVEQLNSEIDSDYEMNAAVWDEQTAVISIKVADVSSDYQSEAGKFPTAEAVKRFEGDLIIAFQQERPISEKERAAGLKRNTLILATFDARTGEPR